MWLAFWGYLFNSVLRECVCERVCLRETERGDKERQRGRYREGTERDLPHRDNLCEDALHTLSSV